MKNLTPSLFAIAMALILFTGCKKKDNTVQKDCEKNNYGVVTLSFASGTNKHSVIITYPNSTFRDKITAKGKTSDTIQLPPGSYPLTIDKLNDNNQSLNSKTLTAAISQCGELPVSVSF